MAKHKASMFVVRNKLTGQYWSGSPNAGIPTDDSHSWTDDLYEAKTFHHRYLYEMENYEEVVEVEVVYTMREVKHD